MSAIKIKPPGRRNGLNRYRARSFRVSDPHGQTQPPPNYGHSPVYVPRGE